MSVHTHMHTHSHTTIHQLGSGGRISRFQVHPNPSSEHNILWDTWGYRNCFNAVILQLFCITNNLQISMAYHIYSCSEACVFPVPLLNLSDIGWFRMSLNLGCGVGSGLLPMSSHFGASGTGSVFFHGGVQKSKKASRNMQDFCSELAHSHLCAHSVRHTKSPSQTRS